MKRSDLFVSAVVAIHNRAGTIEAFADEILGVLRAHFTEYELILIDDGSTDDTPHFAARLAHSEPGVRLVRLSRRFGGDVARLAGLDTAIGDLVIVLEPGDPADTIPMLVEAYQNGADVVQGVANDHSGWVYRVARATYRWAWARFFGRRVPSATTTLFGLSRRAVGALTRARPQRRHLALWLEQIGFRRANIAYQRKDTAAANGILTMIDQGLDLIVSASASPLRLVSYLGCGAAGLNLLVVVYVVAVNLFKHHVAEGWTTLALQNSLMFFLVFLTLVLLAEYVGRLREETSDRPLYHVLEEIGGTPVTGERNVVEGKSDAA